MNAATTWLLEAVSICRVTPSRLALSRPGRVRLGNNVTIGLGSVIEIGVEIGSNSQIGALSFVPKYAKLKGGVVYVGSPAMPLE